MVKERILLVFKEKPLLIKLWHVLESLGYETIYGSSFGKEALNKAMESHSDLIFIENPPEEDSLYLETVELLKTLKIPVITVLNPEYEKPFQNFRDNYLYPLRTLDLNEVRCSVEMAIHTSKIEKKLRKKEKRFKTLYREAPLAYQSLNQEGFIIEVNLEWLEKLGYDREEVLGHWFGDFLTPESREHFRTNFPRFKAAGKISGVTFVMLCRDGSRLNVSFTGRISYDKDGNFKQTHCIFQDITEQLKIEKALKESKNYYKAIFENRGAATIIVEEDDRISLVNSAFEKLCGYSRDEVECKMTWQQFVSDKDIDLMKEYRRLRLADQGSVPKSYEFELVDRDNHVKNIFLTVSVVPGTSKSLFSLMNITKLKDTENELKNSIKEKDLLLKEVHHRVKNNMQIISSLLNLQSNYLQDDKIRTLFQESQNRIRSMAMVHEKLYKSESMSKIDFKQYMSDLVDSLSYNHRINPDNIKKKMEPVLFDVETAIPCGLIINELVTNTFKHAFPDEKMGEVTVELYKNNDTVFLKVADNGIGFPEDIDFKNTKSLGLKLVNSLVMQLDGKIELDRTKGTVFTVSFPKSDEDECNP
ncbi:PAS domain S-box protein [Methanobacterium aggregans]|uniref:PAS domain S-box protein n=1 Tax=Methanobacterium aggregans TaxID=1615586 RepID=UPI001AEA4B4C|nr:PAS domain S-box protein [Methanobacterium aggregans]MBP2046958.1 PAS domain S-box-containing protein [Methanobacterium aggregans]